MAGTPIRLSFAFGSTGMRQSLRPRSSSYGSLDLINTQARICQSGVHYVGTLITLRASSPVAGCGAEIFEGANSTGCAISRLGRDWLARAIATGSDLLGLIAAVDVIDIYDIGMSRFPISIDGTIFCGEAQLASADALLTAIGI